MPRTCWQFMLFRRGAFPEDSDDDAAPMSTASASTKSKTSWLSNDLADNEEEGEAMPWSWKKGIVASGSPGVAGSSGFAGVSRSTTPGGAGDPTTPTGMTTITASGTPGGERVEDIASAVSTTDPGVASFLSGVYPAHAGHADAVALATCKMQRALVLARGRGRLHKQLVAHAKRKHAEVLVGAREECRQSRGRGRRQSRGRGRRQSRGRGCVAVAIGSTHQRPSARAPPGTAATFGGWRPPTDPERKKQFEAIRDA